MNEILLPPHLSSAPLYPERSVAPSGFSPALPETTRISVGIGMWNWRCAEKSGMIRPMVWIMMTEDSGSLHRIWRRTLMQDTEHTPSGSGLHRDPVAHSKAIHEKNAAAVASVMAAVGLTLIKLIVGWWTNSLGILSEAAHSGLDLAAAMVACWAVRSAAKPADDDHPYGHGRIESLSSLFETGLLLVTCVWILWEAIHRLMATDAPEVTVNIWAFTVVIVSIVVDVVRSRHLKHVAEKYSSEALEADALHFSTDVWSSCVVLFGLVGTWLAQQYTGLAWLHRADSVAAIGVALIVIWVSFRMGRKSLRSLMDAISPDESAQLAVALQRVNDGRPIRCRMRQIGAEFFVEVTATVNPTSSFEQTHALTQRIEAAVRKMYPNSETIVHCEPDYKGLGDRAKILTLAARYGLTIHHLTLTQLANGMKIEYHLELPSTHTVQTSHDVATGLEDLLRRELKNINEVVTHCEPVPDGIETDKPPGPTVDASVPHLSAEAIREFLRDRNFLHGEDSHTDVHDIHGIEALCGTGTMDLSLHVTVTGTMPLPESHELAEYLEQILRHKFPELGRVCIHIEPENHALPDEIHK